MYKHLSIEYSSVTGNYEPLTLHFRIYETPIAQKWAALLDESIKKYTIDDPERMYGFDTLEIEKIKAINAINNCIDIINTYKPGFIEKRLYDTIDQDTLNYLHHIFEVYHGMLNEPHEFFQSAPKKVQRALGQLNLEVHRCEAMAEGTVRKMLPTHLVTYYDMPRGPEARTLDLEDYNEFEDFYMFGTVYLLYVEIGKTLQDLSIDDDHHISDEAYKPFRHYASDFVIRYFQSSQTSWLEMRKLYKRHYDENKEFYDARYEYSHPYNRPGNIPLATIDTYLSPKEIVEGIRDRQRVTNIQIV